MTETDEYSFRREGTGEDEIVVFLKATDEVTEVPMSVVRKATRFVTELTDDYDNGGLPEASVTVSAEGYWEVGISKWWENPEVKVTLREYQTLKPLHTWDMIEVDPF